MLGLSAKLLAAAERGEIRHGRDAQEMDLDYRNSTLSLERPARTAGVRAGERAPDAPCRSASGHAIRLFSRSQGPHWTLLGYEVDRAAIAPRANLRINCVGRGGDIIDDGGNIHSGYGVSPGSWVLIRPDGYVGAIVCPGEMAPLSNYLDDVGLETVPRPTTSSARFAN